MEPSSSINKNLLLELLGLLQGLQWSHWAAHWQSHGNPSYGDHLLLERLYGGMDDEIDTLAEKITSYFGATAVDPLVTITSAQKFIGAYSHVTPIIQRALMMEMHLQKAITKVYERVKASEQMTLGLDDFLMSMANDHETHIYLLRQRLRDVNQAP